MSSGLETGEVDISVRGLRSQRPRSYLGDDNSYDKVNGVTSHGRSSSGSRDNVDTQKENVSTKLESNVNGHPNTKDPTMHGGVGRKPLTSDTTSERGYFARLSIEEKAKQVNAHSDSVRETVANDDGEGPYNSFRKLSVSGNDSQGDPRKAAKQMYAEFSYSPHKRAVEKYTPPLGSAEGLAPRRRDHDIRVIPKAKQSASVTQLKGMFDTQTPSDRSQTQNRMARSSQSDSRIRKASDSDRYSAEARSHIREQSRRDSSSDREDTTQEGLATRKARFEQAEALFRRERKAPPPPVKLEELIGKDKSDEDSVVKPPTSPDRPVVAPKPATKRYHGNLERNIDLLAAKQKAGSTVNQKVPTAITGSKGHDGIQRASKQPHDEVFPDSYNTEKKASHLSSVPVRKGSDASREQDSARRDSYSERHDSQTDRSNPIRLVERKRSGSGGSQDGKDVHELRRKMPPRRASSVEFQGLEESVEVFGKKPIDINAILGLTASSDKIEEEKPSEKSEDNASKKVIPSEATLANDTEVSGTDENKNRTKSGSVFETESYHDVQETTKAHGNKEENVSSSVSLKSDDFKRGADVTRVKDISNNNQRENITSADLGKENDVSREKVATEVKRSEKDGKEEALSIASSKRTHESRVRQNSLEKRRNFLLGNDTQTEKPQSDDAVSSHEIGYHVAKDSISEIDKSASLDTTEKTVPKESDREHKTQSNVEENDAVVEEIVEEILSPTKVESVQEVFLDFSSLENDIKENESSKSVTGDILPSQGGEKGAQPQDVFVTDESSREHLSLLEKDEDFSLNHGKEEEISEQNVKDGPYHGENQQTDIDSGDTSVKNEFNENIVLADKSDKSTKLDIDDADKIQKETYEDMEHNAEDPENDIADINSRIPIERQHSHEPPLDEVSISHGARRRSGSHSSVEDKNRSDVSDKEETAEDEDSDQESAGSGDGSEGDEHEYVNFSGEIDLPPPPERSCLTKTKSKEKRSVVIQENPSSVIFTYGPSEYDRGNPEIDPVTASAEWELEKRVDNMDIFSVDLDKDERGLGLSIIGLGVGTESGVEKLGIFVKSLTEGGSAQKDGRIQVKDQILEVNGTSLVGVTQYFAAKTLKETRGSVRFLMGRDKSPKHYYYDPEYDDSRQLIKELEIRHNEEMGELMRRYHDADDRAADAEQTLEAIRIELCEAEERAHKAESDMEELRKELNFVKNSSVPPVVKMKNEIKKHKPQDTKKNEKIDQLQKLLQEISEKLAVSEGRLGQLHQENVDKQGELKNLKDQLQETEQEHQNTLEQNKQLTSTVQDKDNTIAQLKRELIIAKENSGELTDRSETQRQQCLKLEQELSVHKATSHEVKLKLATLEKREAEHIIECKRLKMDNDALTNGTNEELRKLAKDREHLQQQIKELEHGHEQLKNVHSDFASKEEEYKVHIRLLEEKLQNLSEKPSVVAEVSEPLMQDKEQVEDVVTVSEEAAVESKPNTAHLVDIEEDVVVEVNVGAVQSAPPQISVPASSQISDEIKEKVEEQVSDSATSQAKDEVKVQTVETVEPSKEAPLQNGREAPVATIIPTSIIPAMEDLASEEPATTEVSTSQEIPKSEPSVVEYVVQVEIPGLDKSDAPKRESKEVEPAVNPVANLPKEDTAETNGKAADQSQGGLIEFQYKPGGPFFPDLSDMPESMVDSTSESSSEDGNARDDQEKAKEPDHTSTEAADERKEDVQESQEQHDEVKHAAEPESNTVAYEKAIVEDDEKEPESKDSTDGPAEGRKDRSSFLESLRENPSFKAWLDEEWNIVSQKIKEEEADKIAQQVIDSSPVSTSRSERENEEIIKRSGSAKLDESYFKRTVVMQESLNIRPKLLAQDSQDLSSDTERVIAETPEPAETEELPEPEEPPEPKEPPEPISFDVPETEVLNTTPQLDKLRIARERSHRRPSTPKVALSGLDLEEGASSADEDAKSESDDEKRPEPVDEEKRGKKIAEVQPMPVNQLLFKELAAAAAARPPRQEEPSTDKAPTEKPAPDVPPAEKAPTDEPPQSVVEERKQPVAEEEHHKDHKSKHRILGIKLPKINFGPRRKSQDFLNVDVSSGESSGRESSPVLTSERIITDKANENTQDHDDGVVPFGSKEKLDAERQMDSASTDEAVVPFAEKVAVENGSTGNQEATAVRAPSDHAIGSGATSQSSSGAVSPEDRRSRILGSQDSLDALGSGEETDLTDKSFSTLDWMQRSVNEWDTRQVGLLMVGMGLDQYVDTFQNKGVNGPEFITLNGSKLKDLGVANGDHRAAIKKKVKELKTLEKERNKHRDGKKDGKGKDGRLSKGFWKGKYTLN